MAKLIVFLLTVFISVPGLAAEFSVTPIRLDFEGGTKTGAVTVSNGGTESLRLQVRAFEWRQDAGGKDEYTETQDLVFFPRLLEVEGGGQHIIRVGTRQPATAREKTYRLFIEEIPGPRKEGQGANIVIAFRFGVPIFVKPAQAEVRGEIEELALNRGEARAVVRNTGNQSFVIQNIHFKGVDQQGKEVFGKEVPGWYLLAGAARQYSAQIPKDVCGRLVKLSAEVLPAPPVVRQEITLGQGSCVR